MNTKKKLVKHKNGFGLKTEDAEVYSDTLLDRDSLVLGDSDALCSAIKMSKMEDSLSYESRLSYGANVKNTLLLESEIESSVIECDYIARSTIKHSEIRGETKVKNSRIYYCRIINATIEYAYLSKFIGAEPGVIDFQHGYISGRWLGRPPRVLRFEKKNLTLTEGEGGASVFFNCKRIDSKTSLRHARRLGALYELSGEELAEAVEFVRSVI